MVSLLEFLQRQAYFSPRVPSPPPPPQGMNRGGLFLFTGIGFFYFSYSASPSNHRDRASSSLRLFPPPFKGGLASFSFPHGLFKFWGCAVLASRRLRSFLSTAFSPPNLPLELRFPRGFPDVSPARVCHLPPLLLLVSLPAASSRSLSGSSLPVHHSFPSLSRAFRPRISLLCWSSVRRL